MIPSTPSRQGWIQRRRNKSKNNFWCNWTTKKYKSSRADNTWGWTKLISLIILTWTHISTGSGGEQRRDYSWTKVRRLFNHYCHPETHSVNGKGHMFFSGDGPRGILSLFHLVTWKPLSAPSSKRGWSLCRQWVVYQSFKKMITWLCLKSNYLHIMCDIDHCC